VAVTDDPERRCTFCGTTEDERVRGYEAAKRRPIVDHRSSPRDVLKGLGTYRGYPACVGCLIVKEALHPVIDARNAERERERQDATLERLRAIDAARADRAGQLRPSTLVTAAAQEGGQPARGGAPQHDPKLTPMVPSFPSRYPEAYQEAWEALKRRPRQVEVASVLGISWPTFKRYLRNCRALPELRWPPES